MASELGALWVAPSGSIQGADVTWEMFFSKELDNSEIPEQYRNVERFLIRS